MLDINLIETYDGGDGEILGSDLAMTDGLEGMVYLALFGGSDWWGNDYLCDDLNESGKYQTQTEQVLSAVVLNSSGRIKIENAIKSDLAFFSESLPGTLISVETQVVDQDRLDVYIKINAQVLYMQIAFPSTIAGRSSIEIYLGVFTKEFTEQFT